MDRVGQQVGNYTLVRRLGQGGFAEVYLGEHLFLRTRAALKFLSGSFTPNDVQNFIKEAQIIAALKHPHIVNVYDFGLEEVSPYLVMDYAQHGTLRQRHPAGTKLPLEQIITYVQQIAAALQYIHSQRYVHRDIKPENMLLDEQDNVLLADFGIMTIAHSTMSMETQSSSGTIHYMAPEQIRGHPTAASDQYALAIVVYEWLAGTRPFHGEHFIEIGMRHAAEQPPSLRDKVPNLPPKVEQVINKALEKNEKRRFATIVEFAQALEQAAQTTKGNAKTTLINFPAYAALLNPIKHVKTTRSLTTAVVTRKRSSYEPSNVQLAVSTVEQQKYLSAFPGSTLLHRYTGHEQDGTRIEALSWSTDGIHIATVASNIHVWQAATGQRKLITHGKSATWSPEGAKLITGDAEITQWDSRSWQKIHTWEHLPVAMDRLVWSPDGQYLLTFKRFSQPSFLYVCKAQTGAIWKRYSGDSESIETAQWSPDGTAIALGGHNKTVQVWNMYPYVDTYQEIRQKYIQHKQWVTTIEWSPDGQYIASGGLDKEIHIWNVATGQTIRIYRGHSNIIRSISWSLDGQFIASVSNDGALHIWQPDSEQEFSERILSDARATVASWSPEGKRLAVGRDASVEIWRMR
jgi:serine/threonine protein kinase